MKPSSTLQAALGLIVAVSPLAMSAAAAQNGPPPRQSDQDAYQRGYQAGRADANGQGQPDDNGPPPGYDNSQTPPPPPPPAGYDGSQPPPPPPGYRADPAYAASPQQDRRYEAYAEDWAQRNCVKSQGNTAGRAVIGGLLGALVGSSVAGYHNRGAGALVGGIAGAAGGAAVGSAQDNATSPGCPPGYVARGGAPAFYYGDYGSPYYYAAPEWYRPWIFYGGRWTYRPYPYHVWYYHNYGHGGYGRRGGWNGRRH